MGQWSTWPINGGGGESTTNSLTSSNNSMTSDVNGVSDSANIVNSNALSLTGTALKSTVNGVDSVTVDVQPPLTNPVTSSTSSAMVNQLPVFTGTGVQVTPTATNTAFNKNFETSTANIKMDGAVSVGSSGNVVNSDHVHPSDTSKQNIIATPTANDLVSVNNAGQVIDSGISVSTVSTTSSDTVLLTSKATQTAIANAITGSEDLRGGYDASSNTFPTTGGTGSGETIKAGNYWYITVQGTLGGEVAPVGSSITALIDAPGQTAGNWLIIQDAVNSVFGRTGLVTAQTGDYNFSQISGTNAIIQGGTGATTQQAAINALTGTQSAGKYVRSDGTNATLSSIQANDVPTLNQNTTGTAANITATSNSTLTGLPNLSLLYSQLSGTVPTWNQSTTGNAATATNLAGGVANNIAYQTAANTTSFIDPVNNAILGTNGSGVPSFSTYAQVNSALAVNTNIQYVTPNGNNSNNGLSFNTGVATLAQALTNLGNVAGVIFVAPKVGGYPENTTITAQNINITSLSLNSAVDFTGAITFAQTGSNIQVNNIGFATVIHNNAGALYMYGGSVKTSLTSSGTGYFQSSGTDLQATSNTISITGSKSVTFANGTLLGNITINNANAVVSMLNCLNSKAITLTAGVVGINNTTVYSASAGASAISVAAGAALYMTNSTALITGTNTPALINVAVGGFYSFDNSVYSASSTLSGTRLTRIAYFDSVNLAAIANATQVTAMLDNFVGDAGLGGTKGLVPAPAAGDGVANKYLNATGSWSVPAGGGAGTGTIIQHVSPTLSGYLPCNGGSYNRSDYNSLFALLNTEQGTATLTIATPCVVTKTNHGLTTGQKVYFTTTGALPTGLAANTTYWINVTGINTFNLSSTYANLINGIYIATSGTQSGVHTAFLTIASVSSATTFNTPDYQNKVLANASALNGVGKFTGTETQTLSIANLPSHNHNIIGDSGSGIGSGTTADRVLLNTDGDVRNVFVKTTELTGSGTAHNNMQPTEFVYFHIKY